MRLTALATLLVSSLALVSAADEFEIIKTTKVVCDRKTQKGDNISVHYRGTLQETGEQFDASYDRGQPFKFALGAGRVIKGWDEGLLDMCIGEHRKLIIPYQMAYGERGMPPVIPPKATLVFETELLGIAGYNPSDKQEL
ncbi:Peptidyl-prolyl cis-trans isomerase fpr2 [Rhizina undulata]